MGVSLLRTAQSLLTGWTIDKVDVLIDHLNVSDNLPFIAELNIKNPSVNVENEIIKIKP